jgi:hypothetical protein
MWVDAHQSRPPMTHHARETSRGSSLPEAAFRLFNRRFGIQDAGTGRLPFTTTAGGAEIDLTIAGRQPILRARFTASFVVTRGVRIFIDLCTDFASVAATQLQR